MLKIPVNNQKRGCGLNGRRSIAGGPIEKSSPRGQGAEARAAVPLQCLLWKLITDVDNDNRSMQILRLRLYVFTRKISARDLDWKIIAQSEWLKV